MDISSTLRLYSVPPINNKEVIPPDRRKAKKEINKKQPIFNKINLMG